MDAFKQARNIEKGRLDSLVERARDWAVANGILMIAKDSPSFHFFGHAPFTLFASPFPKTLFVQGLEVQRDFNLLVDKVSKDQEFLRSSLQGTIEADEFTRRLFKIYDTVQQEGVTQKISLGLFRSDYMMNSPSTCATNGTSDEKKPDLKLEDYEIKQIEINTIASSFGGIGSRLTHLHRYVQQSFEDSDTISTKQLPENGALHGLAEGIVKAWSLYGNKSAVVLMVVQGSENNRVDQRVLEYSIRECNPAVKVVRHSLQEVEDNGELKEDKSLLIAGKEVAVAYFRAGYSPDSYQSEKEWSARLKLERSCAVKCPTIAYQLVGTKKVQQVLAEPGVVERFVDDPNAVKRIRKTFAGLYSLDNSPEGDKNAKMAMANPERYVVKPQREGGGNNIFGEDIRHLLSKNDGSRTQYILMEKIFPPVLKNYVVQVHKKEIEEEDVISEFGVFGVVISDGDTIVKNDTVGHLLRTKSTIHEDGGVAALRAVLDSPYLV